MAPKRARGRGRGRGAWAARKRANTGDENSKPTLLESQRAAAPEWVVGRPCRLRLNGSCEWTSGIVKQIRGIDKRVLQIQLDGETPSQKGGSCRVSLNTQPVHVAEDFVWAVEPADTSGSAAANLGERTPALLFCPLGPPEAESCGPKGSSSVKEDGDSDPAFSGRVREGEFLEVEVAEPSDPSQVSWKPAEVRKVLSGGRFTCCVNGDEEFVEEYCHEDEGTEWRKVDDQAKGREAFEAATRASIALGVQLVLIEFQRSKRRVFVSRMDCFLFVRHMWKRRTPPAQLSVTQEALNIRKELFAPTISTMGHVLVGKRLGVYWPDDDEWYCGKVVDYDPKVGTHDVLYDDEARESLDLAKEIAHLFLDPADEADFEDYARMGACWLCGLSSQLARVLSPEEAAKAKAQAEAAAAEANAKERDAQLEARRATELTAEADNVDSGLRAEEMEVDGATPSQAPSVARAPSAQSDKDARDLAISGDSLKCRGCRERFHFGCLDTNLEAKPELWDSWRCLDCKTCEVCREDGTKMRLAVCEDCDEGYHIGCLDPPLKSFPFRNFKCPKCVVCSSCGTREAKKWRSDYTMCEPCGRLFKERKYCPICLVVYKNSEVNMVQCDRCRFWLHSVCDGLDEEDLLKLQDAEEPYSCPNCRGERTYTLLLQVLDALQKEDRQKFFAEPVSVEYALAMNYHTVVDQPMDFKTMRTKINTRAYGDLQLEAITAFQDDFRLMCTNAQAFHRPNERVHIVAKRLLNLGNKRIETTFPWLRAEMSGSEGAQGTGDEKTQQEHDDVLWETEEARPLELSPWHHAACVTFSDEGGGALRMDSCLVCGGLANKSSPWSSDRELLRCIYCAESYHSYCTPAPCPEPTAETHCSWSCPRCRLLKLPSTTGGAEVPVNLPVGTSRCARCDKAMQRKSPPAGESSGSGVVICPDCRCCEGCGKTTGSKGWSEDGVWCPACAPAGLEERVCGICSRVYDNDSDEASMMISCDSCHSWVHHLCDGLSEDIYYKYSAGVPGFERYECPDCRSDPPVSTVVLWRQLERLVGRIQQKRLANSAELLPNNSRERSALNDPRRRTSLQRWVNERAALGVPWAVEALRTADNLLLQPLPQPKPSGARTPGKNKDGYVVTGTPADDCGQCAYCKDKPKFGGPNITRKPCLVRRRHVWGAVEAPAGDGPREIPELARGSMEIDLATIEVKQPFNNAAAKASFVFAKDDALDVSSDGQAGSEKISTPLSGGHNDSYGSASALIATCLDGEISSLPTAGDSSLIASTSEVHVYESDHSFVDYSSDEENGHVGNTDGAPSAIETVSLSSDQLPSSLPSTEELAFSLDGTASGVSATRSPTTAPPRTASAPTKASIGAEPAAASATPAAAAAAITIKAAVEDIQSTSSCMDRSLQAASPEAGSEECLVGTQVSLLAPVMEPTLKVEPTSTCAELAPVPTVAFSISSVSLNNGAQPIDGEDMRGRSAHDVGLVSTSREATADALDGRFRTARPPDLPKVACGTSVSLGEASSAAGVEADVSMQVKADAMALEIPRAAESTQPPVAQRGTADSPVAAPDVAFTPEVAPSSASLVPVARPKSPSGPTSRSAEEAKPHTSALAVTSDRDGAVTTPDGAEAVSIDPVCVLCARLPNALCGRLLPVGQSVWVHVNCAIWSSEVFEKEPGVLSNLMTSLRRAAKKECASCNLPGASVGCFNKRCNNAYHFLCARDVGCSYVPNDGRSTWCPLHTPVKAVCPLPSRQCRSIVVHRTLRMNKAGENDVQLAAAAATNGRVYLRVGGLRILSLGRPQPARPQFYERHQLFPLGYTSKRVFHDFFRPLPATCVYTCKIREHAGLPSFIIAHPTEPTFTIRSASLTGAWQMLLKPLNRRFRSLGIPPLELTPNQARLEAALFFGLAVPAVAQLVEQLPGSKACEGFQPRYSRPEALQKVPPLPKSINGCARADPYVKRTSAYKALHTVYLRPFINRGALPPKHSRHVPEAVGGADGEEIMGVALRRREGETKSAGQLSAATSLSALQKLLYNVKVGRSPIHNWGLFTTCGIPKDAMVVEYKGESMRNVLADLKEKKYGEGALKGQGGDCYMFRLDENTVLDATVKGNVARFMNHCCHPNCYSKVIEVEDDRGPIPIKGKHIVIFAQRDLAPGEEIMYDYKFGVEKEKIVCHCGHPKCLGVMN